MTLRFKIVCDNGSIVFITAKCRSEAISIYAEEKGCTVGWVKDHCIIKRMGREET